MFFEYLEPHPREIKFGGEGKADSIDRGFAITTLRNPKSEYNFSRGEIILADCFDDNQKVPVTVITNEIKKLKDFSVPQLALDGFFSYTHVMDGMKPYPGYTELDKNSALQAVTFVKKEAFDALSDELKKDILGHYEDFNDMVKMPELRHLFFPTMCYWVARYGGNIKTWVDFLKVNGLISNDEKRSMENFKKINSNMFDLLRGRPNILHQVSQKSNDGLFKPLILGIFD